MKVFVSYSHQQGDWVWNRLIPCLKAGGAEVLGDRNQFQAGKTVIGQMDAVQDQAERHILVLTPEYLQSRYCRHEMRRAISTDPEFLKGNIVPILLVDCDVPNKFKQLLHVDLRDENRIDQWDKLLTACECSLGTDVPHWLTVRNELCRYLERNQSVNLVVSGTGVAWRGLLTHLVEDYFPGLVRVDLNSARTIERSGLLQEILGGENTAASVPATPRDLVYFQDVIEKRPGLMLLALENFHLIPHRDYGIDFFAALYHLVADARKLVLLVESRSPFMSLVPEEQRIVLSSLIMAHIELKGHP